MNLDDLINEFARRTELHKSDDDHLVFDDTQVGIEFAFEQIFENNNQLVSSEAISYLFDNHPEVYEEFYKRI